MRKIKKLICIAGLAGIISVFGSNGSILFAENKPETSLIIRDGSSSIDLMEDTTVTQGNGWSYDIASNTLTLDGFNGSGISVKGDYSEKETVTLNIKNKNLFSSKDAGVVPLYTEGNNVMITGDGSLQVSHSKQKNDLDAAIKICGGGVLELDKGVSVSVTAQYIGVSTTTINVAKGAILQSTVKKSHAIIVDYLNVKGTIIGNTTNKKCYGFYKEDRGGASYENLLMCQISSNHTFQTGKNMESAKIKKYKNADEYIKKTLWAPYMALIEK